MKTLKIRGMIAWVLVAAMLAASGRAAAAPAVVKVFEATARQAPSADAAPAQVFQEGAELSVSEEATNGWRRVRLSGGKTAFVRDDEVHLVDPETGPVEPLTNPSRTFTPGPTLYVKNLDHLADLVKEDSMVGPRASSLARRHFAGYATIFGGGVGGMLLGLGGLTLLAKQSCSADGMCVKEFNTPVFNAGMAISLASLAVGYFMLPSRGDLLDVVNQWNGRHADRQFTIDSHPGSAY